MRWSTPPRGGVTISLVLTLMQILSTPAQAGVPDMMLSHDPFQFYGETVGEVHVEGVPWAHDLEKKIQGAVRPRQRLWLPGVQRAIVDILFNDSTPGRHPSRITVVAEPAGPHTVNIQFVLEPTRRIESVVVEGDTNLDHATLVRAANMPLGAPFWPDDAEAAARRIAAAYFEAGWRSATVGWEARPSASGDVTIAFAVVEGPPTTLAQLEFTGEKGLSDGELLAAFSIERGGRVALEAIDDGVAGLLQRYHERHYYLAKVTTQTEAADARAVVEVHLSCGPRFDLQVRGNRTFTQDELLSKLHYSGEDPLDENVERDMALRLAMFYAAAGFANATVFPCENAPGVVGCVADEAHVPMSDSGPGTRLVTFLVHEGSPTRVVERRFEGVHFNDPDFTQAKLLERVDTALKDAIPSELTTEIDEATRARLDSSGMPGKAIPEWRVVPSEVYFEPAYRSASEEIVRLYQYHGFLSAHVGDPRAEDLGGGKIGLVIPVDEGPQTLIRSVSIVRWKDFNPTQATNDDDADYLPAEEITKTIKETLERLKHPPVQAGLPVSSISLEDARKTIIQLYKSNAHLFVKADYREVANDAGDAEDIIFGVRAGKEVRVSSIEIKGATHTNQQLIRDALKLKEDDPTNRVRCEEPRVWEPAVDYTPGVQVIAGGERYVCMESGKSAAPPPKGAKNDTVTDGGGVTWRRVPVVEVSSCVTPKALDDSVFNLLQLQIFTSAAVDIADPDRDDMPNQRLIVQVREKASVTVEVKPGLSLADGPRIALNYRLANLGGQNRSFAITAKLDYPVFRYNDLFVASVCGEACALPNNFFDRTEWNISATVGSPIYRTGETPIDQHYDIVTQNVVRPAYQLQVWGSLVGTFNNLLHKSIHPPWAEGQDAGEVRIKRIELAFDVQSDVEDDFFTRYAGGIVGSQSTADEKALLLPNGRVALFSWRPTISLDARDDKVNPTVGVFASLTADFAQSFIETTNPVELVRGLLTVSGYVPIYRPQRIELVVSGRLGGIASPLPSSDVIATKRFFLGGTATLRGYNEDGLVPEDQREEIHQAIYRCHALISQGTCGTTATGQSDSELLAVPNGTGVSTGGDYMALLKAELRVGLLSWVDGFAFIDGGNLWVDPSKVNLTDLRYAVGGGFSVPLPIGPAELGIGVPLRPDPLLQEPTYRIFLSIGTF